MKMQEIFYIVLLSVGSFVVIFLLTKWMGNREMSQLSMFDYVNSITIGSIAAEMATSLDKNFVEPLTALVIYAICTIGFAYFSSKTIKMRRFIEGKPLILMDAGNLYRENLKKAKIDMGEFLTQCRVNGYFDISKLETVVLEGNGKMSFLPKAADRPIVPGDMGIIPQQDYLVANVILDGKILPENLKHTGKNEKWLMEQLKQKGVKQPQEVLLATCDRNDKIVVFLKNSKKNISDILL